MFGLRKNEVQKLKEEIRDLKETMEKKDKKIKELEEKADLYFENLSKKKRELFLTDKKLK